MLSPKDHARVAEAVRAAEAQTSGEIHCIVAEEVSNYREVPIAFGAAAALVLPPAALLLGLRPWTLSLGAAWSAAPNLGEAVSASLGLYAIAQAGIFAAAALIGSIPAVRRRITPSGLKSRRVKRTAYAHLASTGLIATSRRTGVLIFASLKDRQVQLLADDAIHREVGDEAWNAAVAALVAGMKSEDPAGGLAEAVRICGAALAAHFPAGAKRPEHGDGLVELS